MTGVVVMVSHSRYRRSPGARRPTGQTVELTLLGGAYGGRMVARQDGASPAAAPPAGERGDAAPGRMEIGPAPPPDGEPDESAYPHDAERDGSASPRDGEPEGPGFRGSGQRRVVFVQGGPPGETVQAEVTLEKRTFAEARATRLVVPAEGRAVPSCVYFGENGYNRGPLPTGNALPGARGACGGCQYQHLDYDAQLALKAEIVADLMRRQARLPDVPILPILASPSPWRYRNRARWIVDEAGLPCYHQAASERLLPVDHCHIVQPVIEDMLRHLSDAAWRLPLRTLVAEITARSATPWSEGDAEDDTEGEMATSAMLLALHPRPGAKRRDLRILAGDLGSALPTLDGVVLAPSPGAGTPPGGGLWGARYFDARFAGYRFHLAPLTFFQVNEPAAELLVARVLDLLGDPTGTDVLDVYAGAGAFSLPIAAHARQVLALDNDPLAVEDAVQSARANGLDNVHVLAGDAAEELNGLPRHAAASAVLDPPRAGLSAQVVEELARIDVPRIIYVSCDPATLARDLVRFGERGYRVESVQPVDLFPQTFHIESIAVLSRA